MFNRDKVLSDLYTSKDMEAALSKWNPAELREDLKQEVFEVLCKMQPEVLRGIVERKQINYYIVGIMHNMIASDRSTFYNTHRRFREKQQGGIYITLDGFLAYSMETAAEKGTGDEYTAGMNGGISIPDSMLTPFEVEPERWLHEVGEAIEALDPYERGLLHLYVENGNTCKKVAELTTISERGVRFAVSKARVKVKQHLRK